MALALLVGLVPAAAGASPRGSGAALERGWWKFWKEVTTFLGFTPAGPAPQAGAIGSARGAEKEAPPGAPPVHPLGMTPPNPPPTPGDASPGIDPNG